MVCFTCFSKWAILEQGTYCFEPFTNARRLSPRNLNIDNSLFCERSLNFTHIFMRFVPLYMIETFPFFLYLWCLSAWKEYAIPSQKNCPLSTPYSTAWHAKNRQRIWTENWIFASTRAAAFLHFTTFWTKLTLSEVQTRHSCKVWVFYTLLHWEFPH